MYLKSEHGYDQLLTSQIITTQNHANLSSGNNCSSSNMHPTSLDFSFEAIEPGVGLSCALIALLM